MKKNGVIFFISSFVMSMNAASNLIPSLARMSKKLENIVASVPAESPKSVIEKTRSSLGSMFNKQDKSNAMVDIEKKMNTIFWSQQTDLVRLLSEMKDTKEKARNMLLDAINGHYPDKDLITKFLMFPKDLEKEKQMLQELDTALIKLLEMRNLQEIDKNKMNKMYELQAKFKQTLTKLIDLSCTLLMG